MRKLLFFILLLCSIMCNAKQYYCKGINFEYKKKSYPHEVISKSGVCIKFEEGFIEKIFTQNKTPEKFLLDYVDRRMEASNNATRKNRVKSMSEVQDGSVNNIPCKFVDFKYHDYYRRVYCFMIDKEMFIITIDGVKVKNEKGMDGFVKKLKIVDTFEYLPE